MKTPDSAHGLTWGIPLGLFLLLGLGAELLVQQYALRQQQTAQQRLLAHANEVRAVLQAELNATLHLATGMASYIQARNGQLDPEEMQPWLQGLFGYGRHIRNIGLAPGNRISFLYPLVGNEAAIGLYYPDIPGQWPAVERVIKSGKPILDGPLTLIQGGQGLIYRIPVFLSGDTYWGIISTVIDFDSLFGQVQAVARQREIAVDLKRAESAPEAATQRHHTAPLTIPLTLANSTWDLSAYDLQPTKALPLWLRPLGWSMALAASMLVGLALISQQRQTALLKALNRSQAQFMQAFELAPQGMALVDSEGSLKAVNQALCQLLKTPDSALLQHRLSSLSPEDEHARIAGHLSAVAPGSTHSWAQHLIDSQQQRIAVECSAATLGHMDNLSDVRILHIQDIRERKRLQRLQNEFTASVSHELRTPLTAIAGSLGLINGGALGEVPQAMRGMLEIAQANSQRLQELINDLLDMDKLLAGKMQFDLHTQPLWPLLEQAVTYNQPYAEQHRVALQLLGPPTLLQVTVDEKRLAQVLANLLSNAAKFSPPGGTVQLTMQDQNGRVRINVSDQGPGIAEDFKPRLFSKFAQADATDTRQKGGTGLGLAISKELIERMDGEIGFDSIEGQGSTFWFDLPICAQPAQEASQ